jgi:hypothetical protein
MKDENIGAGMVLKASDADIVRVMIDEIINFSPDENPLEVTAMRKYVYRIADRLEKLDEAEANG